MCECVDWRVCGGRRETVCWRSFWIGDGAVMEQSSRCNRDWCPSSARTYLVANIYKFTIRDSSNPFRKLIS